MSISILNNIAGLEAQNELSITQSNLQNTLFQLSSGSRINSGSDDAAGLAIANGLQANVTALNQSASNASDGVGALQVADGSLSQVTTLLNRAVTLATEAATGTVSSAQRASIDTEFQSINAEITQIGSTTSFNGTSVFTATTTSVFLSDANSQSSIGVTVGTLSASAITSGASTVDLAADALTTAAGAASALTDINQAIANVAGIRGAIGAGVNRLNAAVNVINNQVQNLTAAQDQITAANIPQQVGLLSEYTILNQSGISALAQANSAQQSVLKLLQ